jgi:hypothetical protein
MMDAYAQRKGIALDSLRFALDGSRISGDDTPKMVSHSVLNFFFQVSNLSPPSSSLNSKKTIRWLPSSLLIDLFYFVTD